jgi:hypothetical protein
MESSSWDAFRMPALAEISPTSTDSPHHTYLCGQAHARESLKYVHMAMDLSLSAKRMDEYGTRDCRMSKENKFSLLGENRTSWFDISCSTFDIVMKLCDIKISVWHRSNSTNLSDLHDHFDLSCWIGMGTPGCKTVSLAQKTYDLQLVITMKRFLLHLAWRVQ